MTGHVTHVAMPAARQPFLQVHLVILQCDAGNTHLLETQFLTPLLDERCEGGRIDRG